MSTTKNIQVGALKKGDPTIATQKKWSEPTTDLTGLNLIPYLTLGNAVKIVTKENEEIIGKSFKTGQKLVSNQIDNPYEFYARFRGMNYQWYWMMGFEAQVKNVFVLKGTWDTTALPMPTMGSDFVIGASVTPAVRFLYAFKGKNHFGEYSDYAVFAQLDASVISIANNAELSDDTDPDAYKKFTVTAPTAGASVLKMHTYEIDAIDRKIRELTATEKTNIGYAGTTKNKNPFCQLYKHMTEYDMKYQNALCRGFTISSKSEDMVRIATNFLAYQQERSATPNGYIPNSAQLNADQINTVLVPAHFQTTVEIGAIGTPLEEICVSDWTLSVDMPLQQIQTSCSGVHIAEPLLSGKYDIGFKATIARHHQDKWNQLRDLQTPLYGRVRCTYGDLLIEIELKKMTLKQSGADEGDIAAEPLDLMVEYCLPSENPFSYYDGSNHITIPVESQDSPLVIRAFNYETINEMIGE